jgi:hypothetical protein
MPGPNTAAGKIWERVAGGTAGGASWKGQALADLHHQSLGRGHRVGGWRRSEAAPLTMACVERRDGQRCTVEGARAAGAGESSIARP